MTTDLSEKNAIKLLYEKYPHTYAENYEREFGQEVNDFVKRQRVEIQNYREGFLEAFKKDNPEKLDKQQEKHITTSNIHNFLQHGLNEFLSYSEQQLKNYFSKQNSSVKNGVLIFAAKIINIIDTKTIQKFAESNIEVREALHTAYQNIEDALEPNCITRVGDLLEDKQVRASMLMNAAKAAKKQGIKFDPSPYIPSYECYNRKSHGEPIPYLKMHFGRFLLSCNNEKNYLWRGDIALIDPVLYGVLYRDYRKDFETLVYLAGKKSKKEVLNMSERAKIKLKNITALESSSRK
ncbi:MAG: hypothetical protein OCD00_00735 [Colwellia sp.]